jgi:anti-sigma regulatory factor (Ser/Thr protein kinase)
LWLVDDVAREIRASIPADPAHLTRLGREVAEFLEKQAVAPRAAYAIQLVLEELVTNVINYAYDDAGTHEIGVRVALEAAFGVVEIEDDGRPFDPRDVPEADVRRPLEDRPVGGLGLHLVRQMAAKVDYRRAEGKNRVEVRIALDTGKKRGQAHFS